MVSDWFSTILVCDLRDEIRYDSVIYDGSIRYQNRLTGYNLPFFFASDTLFTNYWVCTYAIRIVGSEGDIWTYVSGNPKLKLRWSSISRIFSN